MQGLYKIVFATCNKKKFEEVKEILQEYNIELERRDVKGLEIQSDELAPIALFSAIQAYNQVKREVIVEDSGLFIKSLKGFPGTYSSFVYRTLGLKGILKLMEGLEERSAYFLSSLGFCDGKEVKLFLGKVEGWVSYSERGDRGFGFDPIFIPEKLDKTFGELSLEEKNKISHRSRSVRQLAEWLKKYRQLTK
ncbi:MAG: XTP/dITP diphosphatase [Nitrososphaerales archaeon]